MCPRNTHELVAHCSVSAYTFPVAPSSVDFRTREGWENSHCSFAVILFSFICCRGSSCASSGSGCGITVHTKPVSSKTKSNRDANIYPSVVKGLLVSSVQCPVTLDAEPKCCAADSIVPCVPIPMEELRNALPPVWPLALGLLLTFNGQACPDKHGRADINHPYAIYYRMTAVASCLGIVLRALALPTCQTQYYACGIFQWYTMIFFARGRLSDTQNCRRW